MYQFGAQMNLLRRARMIVQGFEREGGDWLGEDKRLLKKGVVFGEAISKSWRRQHSDRCFFIGNPS
jgi:hypothetical protein